MKIKYFMAIAASFLFLSFLPIMVSIMADIYMVHDEYLKSFYNKELPMVTLSFLALSLVFAGIGLVKGIIED
jgi:hypothetical protein